MNKRAYSNIIRISVLVSLCTQGILSSQSADPKNPKSSERIWSLSDDEPVHSTREAVKKSLTDQSSLSPGNLLKAGPRVNGGEDDWEMGWDVPEEERKANEYQAFFPIEKDFEVPCNDENCIDKVQPTQIKKQSIVPPSAQTKSLYSIQPRLNDSKHPILKNHPATRLNEAQLKDHNADEWISTEMEPRIPADISTALTRDASVYVKEKENKAQINFENLKEPEEENNSKAPLSENSKILGKSKVSVPPYTPSFAPSTAPQQSKQTLTGQKTAYLQPENSKQKNGLFGPYFSDQSNSIQNKENIQQPPKQGKKDGFKPYQEEIIAQVIDGENEAPSETGQQKAPPKTILINFNNVSVIEYIRFISRITNKNFIFDQADLQFNVTIISEEPTTLDNVMTALIQELRIHGLSLLEQGNNLIIHQNREIKGISRVSVDGSPQDPTAQSELVTQVFRLNTLDPEQGKAILRPLLSQDALIETAMETRHIIITDLVANIKKIDTLLKSIDAPNSGLVIGQYVVRNAFMDNLIELAKQIMLPIAQDQNLSFVAHPAAKSIFIVSSPFIVERTISVLQHLDNFQGTTRIYDLDDLRFEPVTSPSEVPGLVPEATTPVGLPAEGALTPTQGVPKPPLSSERPARGISPAGKWELSPGGNWIFRPGFPVSKQGPGELPQGQWLLDPQGNWYFHPQGAPPPTIRGGPSRHAPLPGESPNGRWVLDTQGSWVFQMSPGQELKPARLTRAQRYEEELPVGHIERTKFFIHKLQYKRGDDIVKALQSIAESLSVSGGTNENLISSIQSTQWLETSNALIITGTDSAITKVKELIDEIDKPPRQVMIEMLILDTTIADSLTYGVSLGTKSGGGNTSTAQAFIGGASPLVAALASSGISNGVPRTPDASTVATSLGYNLGIIGQRLTHGGTQFATLGALITAIHTTASANIVMSPKIVTEDNKAAEIFVGINSPFLSNSIANDQGSVITTNVEFRDTGTTLKVTPLIGNGNIITLEIEEEVSTTSSTNSTGGSSTSTVDLTPTTSINRTTTRIHVPDKNFVVISGLIQDEVDLNLSQVPCLGGIPVLGAAFSSRVIADNKRNLMIFIRPEIIDNEEEYRKITRSQQQIYKQKNRIKKSWKYEVEQALDFMNIMPPCCDDCD